MAQALQTVRVNVNITGAVIHNHIYITNKQNNYGDEGTSSDTDLSSNADSSLGTDPSPDTNPSPDTDMRSKSSKRQQSVDESPSTGTHDEASASGNVDQKRRRIDQHEASVTADLNDSDATTLHKTPTIDLTTDDADVRAEDKSEPPALKRSAKEIEEALNSFSSTVIRSLLVNAALQHADVADAIEAEKTGILEAEMQKVIDFDHFSKSVWREINTKHRRMRMSDQFEVAFEVSANVERTIRAISDKVKPHSNFETKKNALETLRKIGKTICLSCGDEIARRLHQDFESNECISNAMVRIIESMKSNEILAMRDMSAKGFGTKLEELKGLSDEGAVLSGLERVTMALWKS